MDYYENQYQKLEQSLLEEKKEQNSQAAPASKPSGGSREELSGNWKMLYENLDYEHRKCFWKQILSEIVIDRETHKISGFFLLADRCSN